jgi:type I restriction enzyme, S subunit
MSRKPTQRHKEIPLQSLMEFSAPSRPGDAALKEQDAPSPIGATDNSPGQRPGNTAHSIIPSPERAEEAELPTGWRIRRLGELIQRPQYGLTASATKDAHGPRFLRITDMQESGVNWSTVPSCACDQKTLERVKLLPGDVVIARIGATTGKALLIRERVNAVFASYLIRLRVEEGLDSEFLYDFTNSSGYWQQIDAVKGGRLKQGVNIPLLEALEIPVPPLPEQRAIASVLRTVQRAKEACERVLAATRQLKQSLLHHLFTYGPIPFAHAAHAPLKKTEIGLVPSRWVVVRLGEVAELTSGGTPSKANPGFWAGLVPWASPKDLKRPRLFDVEDHISEAGLADGSRLAPEGSIFIVIRGMILSRDVPVAMAMVPMAFNQDMKAIIPGERLARDYLLYALVAFKHALLPQIGTSAHGTRRISTSAVENLPIPVPPLSEQREIAAQLAAVDAKLAAEESRRAALTALFQSLLHHLMTGKVRLPEFPNAQAPRREAAKKTAT